METVVPEEADAVSQTFSGFADAREIATSSERSELVKIIFDEVQIDFETQKVMKLLLRFECVGLFDIVEKFLKPIEGFTSINTKKCLHYFFPIFAWWALTINTLA